MTAKLAIIAGGGGVLGDALAAGFSSTGYTVVALRRTTDIGTPGEIRAVACDLGDVSDTTRVIARTLTEFGAADALICNAPKLVVAPFASLDLSEFEAAWKTMVLGAAACAQAVLPGMLQRKRGTLIFVGATASVRGGANFAAFASAKFALRGLAQSLAREYQPQGIHVVHLLLDGLLQGSASVSRFGGSEDRAIDPVAVATLCRQLVDQSPSAWTHELDLRPASEKF